VKLPGGKEQATGHSREDTGTVQPRATSSGQIIVIIAILMVLVLLLLAVAVDVGRLFVERSRLERAAQAAADAGIGLVADQMVTQAGPRQTQAAARPACVPDAGYGTPGASCTATPPPSRAEQWLTDDDRATLAASAMQTEAAAEAITFAAANRAATADPGVLDFEVDYPNAYHPSDDHLRVRVSILARLSFLLAGLLGDDEVPLSVEAISEIPQR
jgi:hypothetical protein